MAISTNTLTDALTAIVTGTTDAGTSTNGSYFIPVCNASGEITNKISINNLSAIAQGFSSLITSGVNFDSMTTPGIYAIGTSDSTAAACTNCPEAVRGTLIVLPHLKTSGKAFQIYVTKCTSATGAANVYYRTLQGTNYKWWKITAVQQE